MKRFIPLLFIVLLALCAGCNDKKIMEKIIPPEDEAATKHYFELIRQDRFDEIQPLLNDDMKASLDRTTFEKMRAFIPDGDPLSIRVVGYYWNFTAGSTTETVTLEYQYRGEWLLFNAVTHKDSGATLISGLAIRPMDGSIEESNRFTLAGKGLDHYVMLSLMTLDVLLSVWALILCAMTPVKKRKWLWALFILVGVGKLSMNWTTGEIFTQIAYISVPVVAAGANIYGPWTISICFPLGAFIFLLRRNKLAIDSPGATQGDAQPLPTKEETANPRDTNPYDY